MLTPAQQEQRLDGITATDVAAILGQHPYRSAIDVFREKRGESAPYSDNDRTKWGSLLEPVIRANYEADHGVRVVAPPTLSREWMHATPDGLVYRDEPEAERGLEIKCHTVRLAHLYGTEGTDEVPPHELCQCMWGMAVTGLPRWDLVAFVDGLPREFTIERDDELIGIMIDRAKQFLVDNVRGGAQPEPDGSESYDRYLKAKWKANTESILNIGDDLETFDLVERGKALREDIADRETVLESIVQTIKGKIADNSGLTWKDAQGKAQRLTWKFSKPHKYVDFAGITATMMHTAALTVSGKKAEIADALVSLRAMTGQRVGNSKLSGIAMAKLIEDMRDALVTIAKNESEVEHTKFTPARPFVWPRAWKATKAETEQSK